VTGILCSRFCTEVVLTDHNEEILMKNIGFHTSSGNAISCAGLTAEKLEWGNSDQLNHILQAYPGGFDLVVGADIYIQISFLFTFKASYGYMQSVRIAHRLGTAALSAKELEALPFCAIAYSLTDVFVSLICSVPTVRQSLLAEFTALYGLVESSC
ncbi:unnamed protein product, partial [Ilex paraguariensis]